MPQRENSGITSRVKQTELSKQNTPQFAPPTLCKTNRNGGHTPRTAAAQRLGQAAVSHPARFRIERFSNNRKSVHRESDSPLTENNGDALTEHLEEKPPKNSDHPKSILRIPSRRAPHELRRLSGLLEGFFQIGGALFLAKAMAVVALRYSWRASQAIPGALGVARRPVAQEITVAPGAPEVPPRRSPPSAGRPK